MIACIASVPAELLRENLERVQNLPLPLFLFFFCSRSSFRALTRAKTLTAETSDDTVYANIN